MSDHVIVTMLLTDQWNLGNQRAVLNHLTTLLNPRCVHRNKESIPMIVDEDGKGMIYSVLVMRMPSLVSLLLCKNVMFCNGRPEYAIG